MGPKERRKAVERCLAMLGLTRRSRSISVSHGSDYDDAHACKLREALESLGPVFASFALYMSSRVDLLSPQNCHQLASIPDSGMGTPSSYVRALIGQEIGRSPEQIYSAFEEKPFESRLLFQSHHAVLQDGTPVVVKITHPEAEEQLGDLDLLPLLQDAFDGKQGPDRSMEAAITDFRHSLQQQLDLTHEAKALEALGQDAEEFETLRAPRVYRNLCTAKVLTVHQPSGLSLQDVVSSFDLTSEEQTAGRWIKGTFIHRQELARLLCMAWLRQVLLGRVFQVEPRAENIAIVSGRQIAFTNGLFATLPPEVQDNLWKYLIAVSNENTDMACSCLLREMERESWPANEQELRSRFRQVVPFRDGGWSDGHAGLGVAEHMFVEWRLASERGCIPNHHLPSFYRGLFTISEVARRICPGGDPLADGLREVRLISGLALFRQMIDRRQLEEQTEKYAAMMLDLPQRLDEMLTLAATGSARLKLQLPDSAKKRRQENSATVATALTLVFLAVLLLSHHVASSVAAGTRVERIGAIVSVFLGAMLLRTISRV